MVLIYLIHQVIKTINKIKISGTYLAFKTYINLPGTDFYEWSQEGATAQVLHVAIQSPKLLLLQGHREASLSPPTYYATSLIHKV